MLLKTKATGVRVAYGFEKLPFYVVETITSLINP